MSNEVPRLFDHDALAQRWRRVARGREDDFLMPLAVEDILDRLMIVRRAFGAVLVLGALTEALDRGLKARFSSEGQISHLDPVEMFSGDPDIEKRVVQVLSGMEGTLDLVVSPLLLQGVNDLPGVLAVIRRALKPDGLMIANLLGGRTLHELRHSFLKAETSLAYGVSPHVHPMIEVRDLGSLLQRAGFALPVTDADIVDVTYADPLVLMRELRELGRSNNLADRNRRTLRRDVLGAVLQHYAGDFGLPNGRVRATYEIVSAIGWAPHESQQKPLRPGSAKVRLADALGSAAANAAGKTDRSDG